MEVEEMQTQSCKFPRIRNGNGRIHESAKTIGQKREDHPCPDEEEADGEVMMKKGSSGGGGGRRGGGVGLDISAAGGLGRLCGWPSSRIVRVSRASGGKDRHSKVWTSKGLRDRRVRLSVNTAIQFYDLQDRLGYDQPSKAVEWLLKAAASSIAELPSINTSFPETPQQLSDEKRSSAGTEHGFDSAEVEMETEPANFQQQEQQQQHGTLSKSACSSTSETSKGSGLSLSRSESRIKARERARERAAEKEKEKEKENESSRAGHHQQQHQNVNPISQSSSFTELLTSGINGGGGANVSNTSNNSNNTTSPNGSVHQNAGGGSGGGGGTSSESSLFQKSPRPWSSTMDYFTTGLLGPPSSTRPAHQSSTGFLGQIQLGNHLQQSLASVSSPLFSITGDHHSEIPHFSFVPDHLVPVVTAAAGGSGNNANSGKGENNLNFSISSSSSSGLAGFNWGTLQSNSSTPSLLPQIQRFTPIDGQSGFYISTTASQNAAVAPMENHHHHHFLPRFDAGLQLCYGDGGRHSDHKGKGKN